MVAGSSVQPLKACSDCMLGQGLVIPLEQHGGGVFDVAAEGLQPLRAKSAVDNAVIAAHRDGHDCRLGKAAARLCHHLLLRGAHRQDCRLCIQKPLLT